MWKNVTVSYDYQGQQVTEELYLTIDLDGNQIVILPTAGVLLASQPCQSCDHARLRSDAIAEFLSHGRRVAA
ncbi:uncharacterized protein ACA1_044250 [Acanthamoeba castellanii str. Neff]|uniref:Uncharacterized protein n=1 Tax=Acanthamoeba castellanii (strain ATCC 30010 / Neff) TaxID=1257118 RepID=L8HD82_ACACF|nr:uncharacterized protein ACA1_044250 [Acanthamoeba castellanii str. Neff]ELR23120.1 hypothetical protein ACA1_044250 [Acanthamoeba castellanii str. Neff]